MYRFCFMCFEICRPGYCFKAQSFKQLLLQVPNWGAMLFLQNHSRFLIYFLTSKPIFHKHVPNYFLGTILKSASFLGFLGIRFSFQDSHQCHSCPWKHGAATFPDPLQCWLLTQSISQPQPTCTKTKQYLAFSASVIQTVFGSHQDT